MRISILIILLGLFLSCESKKEIPSNILNRDQMVDILTDIQIIEATLDYTKTTKIESDQISKKYYDSLFSKYNITRQQFEESLYYYKNNVEELESIYSDVITKLNKIQSEIKVEE